MTPRLKYARIERERRYLLAAAPPELVNDVGRRIEDRYLAGTRLRLRRTLGADGAVIEHKLTRKVDVDPMHRVVATLDLEANEFERLTVLPAAVLVKHRHPHAWRGLRYGIDVFSGALAGLVLAEVEVDSDANLAALPLPPFAHCEVSERMEFTGAALATTDPARTMAYAARLLGHARAATAPDPQASTLRVRELGADDPPLLAAAFAAMGWHKPETQFRRYLDEHARGVRGALVAERNDELAGYVTVRWTSAYEPFRAADIPEIEDLNVLAHARRRGVASALLDEAEARIAARSRQAGIGVGLHPGYNAAQRLYVLRGYVPDGRGVTQRGAAIDEGATARFDDDLLLHLVKAL